MRCCSPHAKSANKIFSFFAKSYRKRFQKKGFEQSQIQLLQSIQQTGFKQYSILEIGCGVGHLHQTLVEQDAASAVGVDLAKEMIAEAKDWANQRGLTAATRYLVGDFQQMESEIAVADVSILDKVICCDPNVAQMLDATLVKTKKAIALTYPRKRWLVLFGFGLAALLMKILRSRFRPYVHDPAFVEQRLLAAGYKKRYEETTFIWLTQLYEKI